MKRLDSCYFVVFTVLLLLFLDSCDNKHNHKCHGINIVENSELLAIYEREGFDEVYIVDRQGKEVAHYILKEAADSILEDTCLPEDAVIINVPVQNVVLDSEIFAAALCELGREDAIKGMFDVAYCTVPELKNKIADARIINLGISSAPDMEKLLVSGADVILISFFEGMQSQDLDKAGIPIIKMYDLQETNPLGRAEWIKLIGRLAGKGELADSIYDDVKINYNNLSKLSKKDGNEEKPIVLTELIYGGVWNVAGGNSYHASLINDAGGKYFIDDDSSSVNLNLSPEQALIKGKDADIWLIRFWGEEASIRNVLDNDPLYKEIKAYNKGNIYFSDTSESGLFRDFPFHPERLLRDYILIFNNDSTEDLKYFKRLNGV